MTGSRNVCFTTNTWLFDCWDLLHVAHFWFIYVVPSCSELLPTNLLLEEFYSLKEQEIGPKKIPEFPLAGLNETFHFRGYSVYAFTNKYISVSAEQHRLIRDQWRWGSSARLCCIIMARTEVRLKREETHRLTSGERKRERARSYLTHLLRPVFIAFLQITGDDEPGLSHPAVVWDVGGLISFDLLLISTQEQHSGVFPKTKLTRFWQYDWWAHRKTFLQWPQWCLKYFSQSKTWSFSLYVKTWPIRDPFTADVCRGCDEPAVTTYWNEELKSHPEFIRGAESARVHNKDLMHSHSCWNHSVALMDKKCESSWCCLFLGFQWWKLLLNFDRQNEKFRLPGSSGSSGWRGGSEFQFPQGHQAGERLVFVRCPPREACCWSIPIHQNKPRSLWTRRANKTNSQNNSVRYVQLRERVPVYKSPYFWSWARNLYKIHLFFGRGYTKQQPRTWGSVRNKSFFFLHWLQSQCSWSIC